MLGLLAWPLGRGLAAVCDGRLPGWMHRAEAPLYRLAGVRPEAGMHWRHYALALLAFNALGVFAVYALQRLQGVLPLNPQGLPAVAGDSAFNTAVSFVSNTNWQGVRGRVHDGLPRADARAVGTELPVRCDRHCRGFRAGTGVSPRAVAMGPGMWATSGRTSCASRPGCWCRCPSCSPSSSPGRGVIQNFTAYQDVATVEATVYQDPQSDAQGQPLKDASGNPLTREVRTRTQTLPMGPVASQEAIKMLGTNGGGFFNANSAHPYENPTPLTNLAQMLAIFLVPAALCFAFGRVVGDWRQGVAILAAMTLMFVVAVVAVTAAEQAGNPALSALGADPVASALQAGGNMEGKEVRFGISASALFAAVTTAASCGAVNAMHDSFTPLGGMVPMVLMQLGEVVFGGAGSGLYGMLVFAILAVFIAGLMIGRTPEYLGKKIEVREMKLTSVAILVTPLLVLVGTAVAVLAPAGQAGIANPGAHGFSEVLYALTSAANNNGSAFAGLSANTPFYNVLLALAMWFGRFGVIVPVLAIAGSLAAKKRLPPGPGTMPTHGPLFVALLVFTVLLVGLLNYVPSLALGPVVEHLVLQAR